MTSPAKFGRKALALVLLAAALVLGCDLSSRLPWQVDLTRERLFTLSDATARMLDGMTTPVQVELYFSGSRRNVPIGLKVFAHRVEQLLQQYERRSGGTVTVKRIDPTPGSREEEEAKRLGLAAQPLGPDERLYFGLAVFHGGARRSIPLIDYRRERLMEYDVSRLIQAVQIRRLPKLAIVSSLEVCGSRSVPPEQRRFDDGTAEWQFVRDLRVSYDIADVHPGDSTLPADADLLLVVNPSGFNPRLLRAIDQFVLAGRPAVIAVDPYTYREVLRDQTDGNMLGAEYHKSSDLPALFAAWGIRYSATNVVADLNQAARVPVKDNAAPVPFPVWIALSTFDDAQPVTAGFDSVLLAHAGHLAPVADVAGIEFTPLLRSSARSGTLPTQRVGAMNPYRMGESITPDGARYTLAAEVRGTFRSAYLSADRSAADEPGEPDPWNLGLTTSRDRSRVIVIADVDFLHDEMAYHTIQRRGAALLARPRNNNAALLANCLDALGGSTELLAIRAKGQAIRPFVRVHRLKREAAETLRHEVHALNSRVAEIEQELESLQRQAAQAGGSLVSEHALTAIRRAQKEQHALHARRTGIEQQLQQRIDALHRRLTLANLGIVPALVTVGGLVFWRWRTRRRVS